MRELNNNEMEMVAGCGFFADIGTTLGSVIGNIVDMGTSLGGLKTNATASAGLLGGGIGKLLEMNFVEAVQCMGTGIVGIVHFGIDAIAQIKAKK